MSTTTPSTFQGASGPGIGHGSAMTSSARVGRGGAALARGRGSPGESC